MSYLDQIKQHQPQPRIGISACLLGERVRYDGGHKRHPFLADTLAQLVEFVPICPEVEVGMGTPRETLHLVGDPAAPLLLTTETGQDHTGAMQAWAAQRLSTLAELELHGYIFKSRSPSCGLLDVPIYPLAGGAAQSGRGLFASALLVRFPALPVTEESRLNDVAGREDFLARVFIYYQEERA